MCDIVGRLLALGSAIWLVSDQIFDVLTTKLFYEIAVNKTDETYPFKHAFMYGKGEYIKGEYIKESAYFFASAGAMLLPIPIGMACVMGYQIYENFVRCWNMSCCNNICCNSFFTCLSAFTFLPFYLIWAFIISLLVPLSWIFAPFLHFIQALFALFGVKPEETDLPIQVCYRGYNFFHVIIDMCNY